jgi:hypothetical protein
MEIFPSFRDENRFISVAGNFSGDRPALAAVDEITNGLKRIAFALTLLGAPGANIHEPRAQAKDDEWES